MRGFVVEHGVAVGGLHVADAETMFRLEEYLERPEVPIRGQTSKKPFTPCSPSIASTTRR